MSPKPNAPGSGSRTERRQDALHRRRQQAAARTSANRKATRRRRWVKGFAGFAVIALLVGAVVTVVVNRGDDAPSAALQAKKVPGVTGLLPIATVATSYRAVYRSEAYEGSTVTVSTEEVSVRRPFEGRVSILDGKPPGGEVRFEGRSAYGVYANYTDAGAKQIADDAPSVALGDVRIADLLPELVDQGLFVPGDRRRAIGRDCQTFRTGSPLQSLKITAPTEVNYVDVCLDEIGLIIEEIVVVAGQPVQRLTATSIEIDIDLDPALFVIEGERVGAEDGGAVVTEVDRTVAPTPGYWAFETTPTGFTHRGRYLVAAEASSYVDVYVRGIDIFTVRQGEPGAEPDLTDTGTAGDIDMGPLGPGQLLVRSIGPSLVAHPESAAFVHITGTLDPNELRGFTTGLRRS